MHVYICTFLYWTYDLEQVGKVVDIQLVEKNELPSCNNHTRKSNINLFYLVTLCVPPIC